MGSFVSAIRRGQWDIHELFSYKTTRQVKIRDGYLGLFYFGCLLIVFIYVGIVEIIVNQQYRALEAVSVSTEPILMNPELTASELQGEDVLGYCEGSSGGNSGNSPKKECRFWDDSVVRYPPYLSNEVFMTTRVEKKNQTLNTDKCFLSDEPFTCEYEDDGDSKEFYVAQPEWFRLHLDHGVVIPARFQTHTSSTMEGKLLGPNGNEVDPCEAYKSSDFRTCGEGVKKSLSKGFIDEIPLKTLLDAVGIDLDDEDGSDGRTFRENGVKLQLDIFYDNFFTYSTDKLQYTYSVHRLDQELMAREQVSPASGGGIDFMPDKRTIVSRSGISILISSSATVGFFNFQSTLVQIVSSVVLIAIAKKIADIYAFYGHKMKYIYRQYHTVTSVKYKDIEHLTGSEINKFRTEDLINPKPAIFQGDTEMVNLAGRATGDSSQRRVPPRTEGATSFDEFMENTQREEGPRAINRINPLQTRDVENQEGKKR